MALPNKPSSNDSDERYKQMRRVSQLSDIALTMGITIVVGVFAGKKLDAWVGFEKPVFTLVLTMFAIFGSFYMTYKKITKTP